MKGKYVQGQPFRVLSLDGGGAKGFYTLGVLKEIEGLVGPLHERFDVVFGTSTGAIIAALVALGLPVADIHTLYQEHVVTIMKRWTPWGKTAALVALGKEVFGEKDFTAFKTNIGIVTTDWETERPRIFKTVEDQAFGRKGSFVPGFGALIRDAVQASCSAYPFFCRKVVTTSAGKLLLTDGGFCANNPTLYAIADATGSLAVPRKDVRVVSIGVGEYPRPHRYLTLGYWFGYLFTVRLLQKTLEINTQSMEQLRKVLFPDVPTIRVNNKYAQPELATDLFEHDLDKLGRLWKQGSDSFAEHEPALRQFLLEQPNANT
jgi:patatin-like phospholipase/acyl hydrolase